jgi:GNAT superfamily N-acetyltransferase
MSTTQRPASSVPGLRVAELTAVDELAIQAFFEANPGYFMVCNGEPPKPDEAHQELKGDMPDGWNYDTRWIWGYIDEQGSLVALINIISDLWSTGVWHIAFFIVDSARHGSADARLIHGDIERWAQQNGAQWMRLVVVQGNVKAERFWAKIGYQETRTLEGIPMGKRINTLRMMVRPLGDRTLQEHLQRVPRDRPEAK